MISETQLHDLNAILQAQRLIVRQGGEQLSKFERSALARSGNHAEQLRLLEKELLEIESAAERIPAGALGDWSPTQILSIYEERESLVRREMSQLHFHNWDQFTRDSLAHAVRHGSEGILAWESFLTTEDLEALRKESEDDSQRWDKLDYAFVGAAGIIGCLVDMFLVRIPTTMNVGSFAGQEGSKLTEWLQGLNFPESWQGWLEKAAKVPYDNTGGSSHRIDTFGHCPVLGWILGVADILRGSSTSAKGGKLLMQLTGTPSEEGLVGAIVRQFLHLVSDVATKRGLPVPFAPLARLLDFGSFKGPTGKARTISQLSAWMYHHGYDLRHMITMGTTPAAIEIVLRAYLMIRHYSEKGEVPFLVARVPKYRSMLLSAHAIACAGNAGKVALMQGNPLAVNYAEWLALTRYLVPSTKYWLFDKARLQRERMEGISEAAWNDLLSASDRLLPQVYQTDLQTCVLGRSGKAQSQ